MNTWVVFLRGVNVSGKRKLKMVALKASLEANGFLKVATYIQSGNLVLQTPNNQVETANRIEELIKKEFDFEVPVLALPGKELNNFLEEAPFKAAEPKKRFFTLLLRYPKQKDLDNFKALAFEGEEFEVLGNCVYLHCKNGAAKAKLGNTLIEKKLKVPATTRNLNTMRKMVQMAMEIEN